MLPYDAGTSGGLRRRIREMVRGGGWSASSCWGGLARGPTRKNERECVSVRGVSAAPSPRPAQLLQPSLDDRIREDGGRGPARAQTPARLAGAAQGLGWWGAAGGVGADGGACGVASGRVGDGAPLVGRHVPRSKEEGGSDGQRRRAAPGSAAGGWQLGRRGRRGGWRGERGRRGRWTSGRWLRGWR